jgi:hypothetical protein
MPGYGHWDYVQVEYVAENLEDLANRIYDTMAHPGVPYANPAYRLRLMAALEGLAGATENYVDEVERSFHWSDTIHDLFYVDEQLELVERTLSGFSQSYRVQTEMRLFRYYVNELLWQYRYNY